MASVYVPKNAIAITFSVYKVKGDEANLLAAFVLLDHRIFIPTLRHSLYLDLLIDSMY